MGSMSSEEMRLKRIEDQLRYIVRLLKQIRDNTVYPRLTVNNDEEPPSAEEAAEATEGQ